MSSKLAALDRPSTFERMSIQNFFWNTQPIVKHEGYIGNTADLITLKAERDDAWLDRQILRILVRANNRVLSVSCPWPSLKQFKPIIAADNMIITVSVDILEQSKHFSSSRP